MTLFIPKFSLSGTLNCTDDYARHFHSFNISKRFIIELLLYGGGANRKLKSARFFVTFLSIVMLSFLPELTFAKTITFSSNNPAIPLANLAIPSTKQVIYRAVISLSGFGGAGSGITSVSFTPCGTFIANDISDYVFYWNTTDNIATASQSQNADAATISESGNLVTITINNPYFSDGTTYYVWIAANIRSTANPDAGHTITVGALTPGNFGFTASGVTKTGTMYAGGTQTLVATGPNILSGTGSLLGFSYVVNNGPSANQFFTIGGTGLTQNITITAPVHYEISTSSNYSSYSNSIILPQSGGTLSTTPVYVRLKAGLDVGSYNSENIILTSTGATNENVTCSGAVTCSLSPPIVTTPLTYCQNSTASQLTATGQNLLWQTYGNNCVGGTTNPTSGIQTTPGDNKITSFTVNSTVTNVSELSVDWDIPAYQTVTGAKIAIQTSSGGTISNGTQINAAITATADIYPSKQTSTFSNLLLAPGNYRIALVAGSGKFGTLNSPVYPQKESSGSIDITGNTGGQLYYNLQFSYNKQSAVAPTPITTSIGTTSYYVTQTVGDCTSGAAAIHVVVNSICPTYYRTIKSGDWNSTSIWEQSIDKGANWSTAISLPTSSDIVTIQSGHMVTLSANVTASLLTIYGTLDLGFNTLTGTGTLSVSTGGNLVVGDTSNYPTGFTTSLSIGSTVNYNKPGNQTVFSQIYSNLTLSGSGIKNTNGITVNGTLSIEGTATTSGTIASYGINSTLQYKGITTQSIENNMVLSNKVYNLTVANTSGVYLNTDFTTNNNLNINPGTFLTIEPAKTLSVGATVSNLGGTSGLVIKADQSLANGSLTFTQPVLNHSVQATVEMYSKACSIDPSNKKDYRWQYFGIPISSANSRPTFDGSYIRWWDESAVVLNSHWKALDNASILTPFTGYEITQDYAKTIVFQGLLINKDTTFTLSLTNSPALYPGQHILANPYTAAINIKKLNFVSGLDAVVYLYNTGSYNDWNVSQGTVSPGNTSVGQYNSIPQNLAGDIPGLPAQIPSMQGFLVVANTNNAVFTIPYSSIEKNTVAQRTPVLNSSSEIVSTCIDVKSERHTDRMWIFSEPGCTHNFDNGWDGRKMPGSALIPQIFAMEPDGNYQVNTVEDINNIILGFQTGEDMEYTLIFTHQNLKSKYAGIFLVDLLENKTTDITESGSTYSFIAESTPTTVKRFMIATRPYEKGTTDVNTQIKVFSSGNSVFVQNQSNLNGEIFVCDMTGRYLKKASFRPNGVTAVQMGTISGAYVATAITSNDRVCKGL